MFNLSQPPTSLSKPDQPGLEVWFFSPPPNFPYELFAGVHAEQMLIWKEIYNFLQRSGAGTISWAVGLLWVNFHDY